MEEKGIRQEERATATTDMGKEGITAQENRETGVSPAGKEKERRKREPEKPLTPKQLQQRRKLLAYPLMGLLFLGSMWLIFAPLDKKDESGETVGAFNADIPLPKNDGIIGDKRKAYEQAGLEKKQAELEFLRSQINPHFLYNTLDAIVWLAEAGEQKKVVSMVGSLSDFFRISLNQGQDILDVREELQHVRSYLEIQQMRYQDILQYEICVPEELYSSRIPKITLQPLVENALYHGIKNKRGKGMIRIDGEMEDSDCILRITDNGRGMTPERLGQVREGIRNRNACETEIYGLYNVNERIRLNFGEKYGITITSTYGEGTCVTVRLPEYTL